MLSLKAVTEARRGFVASPSPQQSQIRTQGWLTPGPVFFLHRSWLRGGQGKGLRGAVWTPGPATEEVPVAL